MGQKVSEGRGGGNDHLTAIIKVIKGYHEKLGVGRTKVSERRDGTDTPQDASIQNFNEKTEEIGGELLYYSAEYTVSELSTYHIV